MIKNIKYFIKNTDNNMKTLYIFTAEYPYATKENFLEDEVKYLSNSFDDICFIPLSGEGTLMRTIPYNSRVITDLQKGRKKKILLGLLNLYRVIPLYTKAFFSENVYKSCSKIKSWFGNMIICSYYYQSSCIRNLIDGLNKDDVVYFYWGVVYNTLAPFMKGRAKLVSRFHGDWDLWNSLGEEGYKPMRKYLLDSLDAAVFISKKGEMFFKNLYPKIKTYTFRLGSRDCGITSGSTDGILRIVSCSTVYPLKRVPLIYESIKIIKDRNIEWTHIGDGPNFGELKEIAQDSPANLQVNLLGNVSLDQVLDYYKNHKVDLFMNLSTNEGIPVSIMEAISFNIPVVATDVGGNSEIVTEKTGLLVNSNPTPQEVAKAILEVIEMKTLNPRAFWENEFSAENNYRAFADFLSKEL